MKLKLKIVKNYILIGIFVRMKLKSIILLTYFPVKYFRFSFWIYWQWASGLPVKTKSESFDFILVKIVQW